MAQFFHEPPNRTVGVLRAVCRKHHSIPLYFSERSPRWAGGVCDGEPRTRLAPGNTRGCEFPSARRLLSRNKARQLGRRMADTETLGRHAPFLYGVGDIRLLMKIQQVMK